MARAYHGDVVWGRRAGAQVVEAVPNVSVAVYTHGTETPLTLYAGASGGTTLSNPLTTDSEGMFEFWLAGRTDVDLVFTHADYTFPTRLVHVRSTTAEDLLTLGTQTRQTGLTLTDPVINTPNITDGTITDTEIINAELSGAVLTTPDINGGTIDEADITTPTFIGVSTFPAGSFGAPSVAVEDATLGVYKAGTNSLGVASGTSTRTLKFGAGAFGMVEVVQTNSTPGNGVYSTQGGLPSTSVTPDPEYAAIQGDSVLDMDGLTHVAVKGNMYAVSGSNGFAIGGDFQSIVPAGSYTSGIAANSGTIGLRAIAHTLPDATGQHVLTGFQVNARGEKSNDIIHGVEINLSTLDDAPSTDPAHRIWVVLGNEATKMSRRGTGVDAYFALLRKRYPGTERTVTGATNATPIVITTSDPHGFSTGNVVNVDSVGGNTAANGHWTITVLSSTTFSLDSSVGNGSYTSGGTATLDDTTNVKAVKNCFFFGDGGGTHGNFPFDNTSTFMVSDVAGVMGGFINLANVKVDDGAGTDRGSILTIGSGGANPALDIRSTRDGGTSTLSGWIGIGTAPARPLHIQTAENSVMAFTGTVDNFITASVGGAGGAASLPATPAGYLRINIGGTNVLLPYYVNA